LDPSKIDKRKLLNLLRVKLEADLGNVTKSQNAVESGARHDEMRQEDPKDTRAIEATYLARGLAERVELMREAVAIVSRLEVKQFGPDDPIGSTALVALGDEDGVESIYFLVPRAAGETLKFDGMIIRALTPGSPLGRAMIGKRVDDEVELELPGKRLVAIIAWIR
jgi:transcription elongation GreA/GreB family factor